MKFSKKILIPIFLVIIIAGIFAAFTINNSKYPISNVKSSEIKAMSIEHKSNLILRTTSNSEGRKLLKLVNNILKESNLGERQGGYHNDNFLTGMSKTYPDNYYIEIPFARMEEIALKDQTIKCDVIVICPEEKAIYYHSPDGFTLNKSTLENANFDKLDKFLSSLY